jgi:hypothetical protein
MTNHLKLLSLGFLLIIPVLNSYCQVSISSDNSSPDASAMLDVISVNKGFLPPRVSLAAANSGDPVIQPAAGLLVYNTATSGESPYNVVPGYYFWNGTRWISLSIPQGAVAGEMLYWNGNQWIIVAAGLPGQFLQLSLSGMPEWSGTAYASLSTNVATSITPASAISGGNISEDGGAEVTARGVCWSSTGNPTIADNHTSDGSGIGSFTSEIKDLNSGYTYYLRAYATNSLGTSYGNEVSFRTLSVGDSFQGGVLAYILQPTDPGYISGEVHGLIAAPTDQSTGAPWGCQGTIIDGADGFLLGTGMQNTLDITNGCIESGIAARICFDLELNTYNDWYLPSRDELNKLYLNKDLIGGFTAGPYWSSTEYFSYYPEIFAYYQSFDTGSIAGDWKSASTLRVRAIRSF